MIQRNEGKWIYKLALGAALLFGCLFLIIGVVWARYQENQAGELNYTTKETLAFSLWKGIDDAGELVLGENTWTVEDDLAALDFYIGHGGSEHNVALETQNVQVRLMLGPGMTVDEETELVLWIETEDGNTEYLNGELREITEGTPLYEDFGPGWYYAFCDKNGEEKSWTLEGGQLSVLKSRLILKESIWNETTLLQLLVTSDHHNRAMWNTLLQPFQGVTSDVLVPLEEEQIVLLGELTKDNIGEKEFLWMYFQSETEEVGRLDYDFVDPDQEKYLNVTVLDREIYLSEITTYGGIYLELTEEAAVVTEEIVVDFTVSLTTETSMLTSIFRAILPASNGTESEDDLIDILEEAVPLTMITSGGGIEEGDSGGGILSSGGGITLPKTKGKLHMTTLDDYYIDALIPVMIDIPKEAGTVTVSLLEGNDPVAFPRLTRYSVDDGESWTLLYFSDMLRVHYSDMLQTIEGSCLLLDLSRTVDVNEEEKDDAAAKVDGDTFLKIYAECETETKELSGKVATRPNAMTFNTDTMKSPMILELEDTLLFPLVKSWTEAAEDGVILEKRVPAEDEPMGYGYELVDPKQGKIDVILNDEALIVRTGNYYPEAGTYRLTIDYRFCDIHFADTVITFFVNYSDGALLSI
ncbi:MAG: hypothetical protein II983_03490 [Firmicutes bacterium]|nr:hypothetical protein [Bacillota bacterium]